MSFGVGDGFFKGMGCTGFVTCHGAKGESCAVFPCPPYNGIYAGWWTSGCGRTPDRPFYLSYWTGSRWERIGEHRPKIYEGYVWVRWGFDTGNCGYAYKIGFGDDVGLFLVGEVPAHMIPCEMWTSDMVNIEKYRLKELINVEKADASADVKDIRSEATAEVKIVRGKANIDIAAERAEYKEISTGIRARVKRELVDVRDTHNEYEARIKAEYTAAKAVSDDDERGEKTDVRDTGKIDIADEKRKETDDIGNIRKQRDIDVAVEYQGRDRDVLERYAARDRKVQEIKDSGKPCVIL